MHVVSSKTHQGWFDWYKCTGDGSDTAGCGALLLVEEFDLILNTGGHFGNGRIDLYATFICPICDTETDIPKSNLPDNVYEKVRNYHYRQIKDHQGRR